MTHTAQLVASVAAAVTLLFPASPAQADPIKNSELVFDQFFDLPPAAAARSFVRGRQTAAIDRGAFLSPDLLGARAIGLMMEIEALLEPPHFGGPLAYAPFRENRGAAAGRAVRSGRDGRGGGPAGFGWGRFRFSPPGLLMSDRQRGQALSDIVSSGRSGRTPAGRGFVDVGGLQPSAGGGTQGSAAALQTAVGSASDSGSGRLSTASETGPAPIPEPGTLGLLAAGLAGLAARQHRRRRKA